nr:uncharacterized protein LOC109756596 isoform X1 [Aegilops tauschii subsp. strangulata]
MLSVSGGGKTYLQIMDSCDKNMFRVRHLSQQKELPKYVAFKGDNGKYLREPSHYEQPQQFSASDIKDQDVVYETFTDDYGVVRIKSNGSGRVLKSFPGEDGIPIASVKDAGFQFNSDIPEDTIYKDVDTLFKVVFKDGNNIALQNIGNGKFCKNLNLPGGWISFLSASAANSNTREATFQIEEPVKSREIYDVEYRVGGVKTSSNQKVTRTEVLATNRTHESHTAQTSIEMFDRTESKWDAKLTLDAGIKTKLSAGLPFMMEGEVETHLDFHAEYNWGETKEQNTKRTTLYSYPVPSMTKVIWSIFSREDVIDVPFSYKQRDVLFTGQVLPLRQMHDGIYHGAHSTDIDIDTIEEKVA